MISEQAPSTSLAGDGSDVIEISDPSRLPARPAVTVVMNTYDHAPYLPQAVEGVLAQSTSFPIELIISEDCSRDGTREIAMQFQARRPELVRIVTGPANVGGPRNFRRAIARARGRYIALCEGDDFWIDPSKLQRQVSLLDSDPGIGAVHSEFSHLAYIRGRWRTLERFQKCFRGHIEEGEVFDALVRSNFIQTCTLCLRADLVRSYLQHPLSSRGNPVGDWPLCLFVSANSRIAYIDSPMAVYRKVPGSATNRGAMADIERARRCMSMIEDFCEEYSRPESLLLESHSLAHEHILFTALFHGLPDEFATSLEWLRARVPHRFAAFRWKIAKVLVANPGTRPFLALALRSVRDIKQVRGYT
jgi:glycosyltransferase involved in cell wall biosynthesis